MRQLPRRTYDIKTKAANVELLSGLVSTTLLDLEVKNFDILISEETLSK